MESKELSKEELIEKFITEIKEHINFTSFFSKYSSNSVNSFLKLYAQRKAIWTISGHGFKTEMERMEMLWENEAMHRLAEIQHVKLFLYQCNYRAGLVERPTKDVRTIFDFMYWKENILNARFLEPVSPADINLYAAYLASPEVNHSPFAFIEDWQDFDDIRFAWTDPEESERTVPEWYLYYFSQTGHGHELTLPDIKSERDLHYFQEGNKERVRLFREAEQQKPQDDPGLLAHKLPYFNEYADGNLDTFMQVFENRESRDMLKVWNKWTEFNDREDMMRDDLEVLMYAQEQMPLPECSGWIEATQLAASRLRSYKITESLPAAYGQYKINLDLRITFPEREDSRKNADFYNDLVILGRKMLGEPGDFNY